MQLCRVGCRRLPMNPPPIVANTARDLAGMRTETWLNRVQSGSHRDAQLKRFGVSHRFADGVVGLKTDSEESIKLAVRRDSYVSPCIQPSCNESRTSECSLQFLDGVAGATAKPMVLFFWLISCFASPGLFAAD